MHPRRPRVWRMSSAPLRTSRAEVRAAAPPRTADDGHHIGRIHRVRSLLFAVGRIIATLPSGARRRHDRRRRRHLAPRRRRWPRGAASGRPRAARHRAAARSTARAVDLRLATGAVAPQSAAAGRGPALSPEPPKLSRGDALAEPARFAAPPPAPLPDDADGRVPALAPPNPLADRRRRPTRAATARSAPPRITDTRRRVRASGRAAHLPWPLVRLPGRATALRRTIARLTLPRLMLPVLMFVLRLMLMSPPPQLVPQRAPPHAAPIAAPQISPVANAAPGGYG